MTPPPERPVFRSLTQDECGVLLARNQVGRLAYCREGRVGIEPIHYVYAGDSLFGRTSPGSKLDVAERSFYRSWPMALEVDEVEGLFSWRSVVVHGNFRPLRTDGPTWEREQWEAAVAALRTLVPGTFTEDDPVPFRTVVFELSVHEATGREAAPGPDRAAPEPGS